MGVHCNCCNDFCAVLLWQLYCILSQQLGSLHVHVAVRLIMANCPLSCVIVSLKRAAQRVSGISHPATSTICRTVSPIIVDLWTVHMQTSS